MKGAEKPFWKPNQKNLSLSIWEDYTKFDILLIIISDKYPSNVKDHAIEQEQISYISLAKICI